MSGAPPRPRRPWGRLLLLALAIGGLVLGGREAVALVPSFAEWVRGLGTMGPLLFIAGYTVGSLLLLPGALFTMIGGAVFGVFQGTLYVMAGALGAITGAFLISRHLARGWVAHRLAGRPGLDAIDQAVGRDGFRIVFLLRLSPVFPFSILNYALGLTRVRFRDYLLASVGSIPGTLLYVTAGRVAGDVATVAAGEASPDSRGGLLLLVTGLVATAAVVVIVTRRARQALAEAVEVPPA